VVSAKTEASTPGDVHTGPGACAERNLLAGGISASIRRDMSVATFLSRFV
jgi:hypothetical protein